MALTKTQKDSMTVDHEDWLKKLGLQIIFPSTSIYGMVVGNLTTEEHEYGVYHFQFESYIPIEFFRTIVQESMTAQRIGYRRGRKDLQEEVKGFFKDTLGFNLPEEEE